MNSFLWESSPSFIFQLFVTSCKGSPILPRVLQNVWAGVVGALSQTIWGPNSQLTCSFSSGFCRDLCAT